MDNYAIYLYGITQKNSAVAFDVHGIDNTNKLYSIAYQDIKAIVSDLPMAEYNQESFAKNVEDVEWLKEKAILYSNIMSQIFNELEVLIPLKFGTIFISKENLDSFLNNNYGLLKECLNNIYMKEEWGIKLYCDINKFIDTSMLDEKNSIFNQISGASKGARYFLSKKLEQALEGTAKEKVSALSQKLFCQLSEKCCEGKFNKLLSKEATGMPYDMYMNSVFLLNKDDPPEAGYKPCPYKNNFSQLVEQYKKEYEQAGIYIELSGPWPPYNFCHL